MTAPVEVAPRLLAGGQAPLSQRSAHEQVHGPLPRLDADRLLRRVEASGLTGRGGGRFPVARKLATVRQQSRPVVVANGAEGEPASSKDAVLLRHAPHLVLDGLQAAAVAVGARRAVLCTKDPRPVAAALADRDDAVPVELVRIADSFLSGQETALVRQVDGGPAVPRPRPVWRDGVGRRGTLVQNVETLAHLALIARYGGAWFRGAGTDDEPGTMLVTTSGDVARPAVREVPIGTLLLPLVRTARPLRAVLVGGYHGTWLSGNVLTDTALSYASLARHGATPGAGVLHALDDTRCPLEVSAQVTAWLASQSARQCGPCVNGLPALADAAAALARPAPAPGARRRLEELAGLVDGRGACAHPDGTARFVRSVLTTFPDELAAHAAGTCTRRTP